MRRPTVDIGRLALHVVALGLSAAALFVAAGPPGAAVAGFGVAGSYLTRGVYGVGIHHLGAIALVSVDAVSVVDVVLIEAAATFLLAADAPRGHRFEAGALLLPVGILLAVGAGFTTQRAGLPTAAVALVVVVALGSYLVHRYGRVRLGLTMGEPDR